MSVQQNESLIEYYMSHMKGADVPFNIAGSDYRGGGMKKVILRILFAHGQHLLELVFSEDEAKKMMDGWVAEGSTGFSSGYDREQDRHYSFRHSEVAGMFTTDLEQVKKQAEELKKQQQEMMRQAQRGLPSTPGY